MSSHRNILVVAHTAQPDVLDACVEVCRLLGEGGATVVLRDSEHDAIVAQAPWLAVARVLGKDVPIDDIEIAVVLGGDGTILRTAELLRGSATPLVGINLGRVGFLAEAERAGIPETVSRILAKNYTVEQRMTLAVRVKRDNVDVFETWALNEAALEKSASRMIDVTIEVDRRPLSSFGCDGVVIATPTGSTAYAFSAGGPVVWPGLDAMVLVPLSAHALFARPLVTEPTSTIAVEMAQGSPAGILTCDGRRAFDLESGHRVVVTASDVSVRLARVYDETFTDRLVDKFDLPVTGWRGPASNGSE